MTAKDSPSPARPDQPRRFRRLAHELRELEAQLRAGGGEDKIRRQHDQGKLTARERITLLLDPGARFLEIGLLIAYDRYEGQAPAAGIITGLGMVHGRPIVVVANDATVKAGSWWPETVRKSLRAQEIAMRCRIPIVYLVDSAGVNLPYQDGVFPGQYGGSRVFYYNTLMRRYLGVPQIAAVMGPCVAGGAYLPALSDVILMVEGTSFMGLGGPNLVKGATGQTVDAETLGGAYTHTVLSGVAHYREPDDSTCIAHIRELIRELPYVPPAGGVVPFPGNEGGAAEEGVAEGDGEPGSTFSWPGARPPARNPEDLYELIPDDHRQPYSMPAVLSCLLDGGELDEFQPGHAAELICGRGRILGQTVGVIANARGLIKDPRGGQPRFGGIVYTESAEKAAYFIDVMARHGTPIFFVQDVSGFMVGTEAEHSGIVRAGARFVEAMATAPVPKLVLTINHASGAGYYAMGAQGFDPDFIFTWPTGRMGVMEGESAVMALFGPQLEELRRKGEKPDPELQRRIDSVLADYEHQLDARFAAARGFVDAVILPEDTREVLALSLYAARHNPAPHLGPFGTAVHRLDADA